MSSWIGGDAAILIRRRATIRCARCDAEFDLRRTQNRWCPDCRVFLCASCAVPSHTPDKSHRTRRKNRLAFWVFGFAAILFLGFLAQAWSLDREDFARGLIPVTRIDQLLPGAIVKINGTIASGVTVAIDEVGSGNSRHWNLVPFNLTDQTGSVFVLVGHLQGSRSYREIQTGIHDHDWWGGDPAAIIGDVQSNVPGIVYIVGRYIARSPTSFYRPDPTVFWALALASAAEGTLSGLSFFSDLRRRRLHQKNSPAFPHKVVGWPRCRNCGDYVSPADGVCTVCNEPISMHPIAESPLDLTALPTLRMRTSFDNKPRTTRLVTLVLGLGIPFALVIIFVGTVLTSGFLSVPGVVSLTLLIVIGSSCLFTFLMSYFGQQTIILSPHVIKSKRLITRTKVATPAVDRVLTISRENEVMHGIMTRTGPAIFFGEGLSQADIDKARVWLRDLAACLGLRYHEGLKTPEEILRITGRG